MSDVLCKRITPASPQENATHERMHRELKRETARPAAKSALGVRSPIPSCGRSSLYRLVSVAGPYPERLTPPDYPLHMEVRLVSTAGTFRLHSGQPFLSHALGGEDIGLEEVGDGIWNIVYYSTLLGKIDQRTSRLTGI